MNFPVTPGFLCILLLATSVLCTPAAFLAAELPESKISPQLHARTNSDEPVEMMLILEARADLQATVQRSSTKQTKRREVYRSLTEKAYHTQQPLIALLKQKGVAYRAYYLVNAIWIKTDRKTAIELAAQPEVARIESNPWVRIPPETKDSQTLAFERVATVETSISYVHAPAVWARGYTGEGLVIGGQDTGIQWDHPALKNQYRGWNGYSASHDFNWHDAIHSNSHGTNRCGADATAPCDDYDHGTHTMGTAVGGDGSGNQIGMAPGARWIGCRNMDNGWGSPQSYLECFEFFLAPYPVGGDPLTQGNPDLAPDVTINSWSCTSSEGCSDVTVLQAAVQAQEAAGILTVSSAGNEGGLGACSTIDSPPAIYEATYTVGSLTTGTDTLVYNSSVGPVTIDGSGRRKPDITAPGSSIRSSIPNNNYGTMSGTSMACPHVAGAIALLWSALPNLRNDLPATRQRLNAAAFHLESSACGSTSWPNNTFGYGRLDVLAALPMLGDVNDDGLIGLTDVISALQIAAGLIPGSSYAAADVDMDKKIGVAEALYALKTVAGP
jgi:subtilisin family serine protease